MNKRLNKIRHESRSFRLWSSFSREYLVKLKQKARRKGNWYNDLKQNERMLLDLTIKIVKDVRSFKLTKIITNLVSRLKNALESPIVRLIRTEGKELAKNLSTIGRKLGIRGSKDWANDLGLMQFLVITNLERFGK